MEIQPNPLAEAMDLALETGGTINFAKEGWIGSENNKEVMNQGAVYVSDRVMVMYYYARGYNKENYVTRLSREPIEQAYLIFYVRKGVAFKAVLDKAIR